ncbi:MAG: ABC transporter substrate-binding protein [Clostridium sp.]|nr:ABC transporter substrate-binding protein [Clostridium sp.]
MKNSVKKILSLSLASIIALGLVGCGKKSDVVDEKNNSDKVEITEPLKVVTTSESYKELFDKFTSETGVKVEFLSMSSGEVISKVKAEGGNPMADLWFGGGIDAFMAAKEDGLLEQVDFAASKDLAPEYKDEQNYWFSKGLTVVGFIVNNDILTEKNLPEPKTWDDLTNPVYKGEILMSNPAVSGTNYAVVNAMLQTKGEEAGWKYFEALNENIEYYSKRGKDPNVKTMAGEVAIGITYIDKGLEAMQKEKNVKIIYPEDGIPYVPEGVAAFKNASNVEGAKLFIEWLYKDENLKEVIRLDNKDTLKLVKPNLEGVELTFPKETLMKEDLSEFGAKRTEILEKWESLMGDKAENE